MKLPDDCVELPGGFFLGPDGKVRESAKFAGYVEFATIAVAFGLAGSPNHITDLSTESILSMADTKDEYDRWRAVRRWSSLRSLTCSLFWTAVAVSWLLCWWLA